MDQKRLAELLEEATVDCYDEEEEFWGVFTTLENNLEFPLQARALDNVVEVVGLDGNRSNLRRGILAVVRQGEQEYPIGLAEQLGAVVADIRFSPRSRVPDWSGERLARLLGDRYLHLPALGNRNYKDGPIELVDVEAGTAQVGDLLTHQPVILLCVCADVERCHRRLVAEAVAIGYGVPVIHL